METTTLNPYSIKWAIVAPFNGKFNKNYKSALKNAGFREIGDTGCWGDYFNSSSINSVNRIKNQISKFNLKVNSYKRCQAIFSFVITDKQLELVGTNKAKKLSMMPGWVGLPVNDKIIAITYNQMYADGAISLKGSQAQGIWGKRFDGSDFKRVW